MATANDFKILSQISLHYFETLIREDVDTAALLKLQALPLHQKSRLGFYILALEQLSHLSDYTDIADHIIDSEFNQLLYSDFSDDFGVDAVVIDDDAKHIKLFNFKYRENFKVGSQAVNDTILSTKYLNAIYNADFSDMTGKPLKLANVIKRCHQSNDVWRTTLYVVSNEDCNSTHINGHLRQLQDSYDLGIISIGLNEISDLISLRPSPVNAAMMLDPEAVMSFTENPLDSSKSYIFRLSLAELVRITSKDSGLRMEYNLEDLSKLSATSLDSSVLFDNVRGFVLKSKFNSNIADTIKTSPTKFFMYNNGLTLIATDIISQVTNSRNKVKVDLSNFQVLNGGQTLRTVHDFNNADVNNISEYLCKAEVLVRIFKTQNHSELNSKIAEYTNSQNTISNIDLKSLRKEQINLEQYLQGHDILYSRKTGDTGSKKDRSYRIQISMEKFGQILMTYGGQPEKAVNAKKSIFDKLYDHFFVNNKTLLEDSVGQIEKFYEVKNAYKPLTAIESSDQKIFYIMYILEKTKLSIDAAINLLEQTLDNYQANLEKDVARSRLMIHTAFKNRLDQAVNEINKIMLDSTSTDT
jgi:uncharacterized protein YdcH (DUF465 family)